MIVAFDDNGWQDYVSLDEQTRKKANRLIADIKRTPFEGLGKPEPLRHQLQGYWSRRITREHRLVYKIKDDTIVIAQARHHY